MRRPDAAHDVNRRVAFAGIPGVAFGKNDGRTDGLGLAIKAGEKSAFEIHLFDEFRLLEGGPLFSEGLEEEIARCITPRTRAILSISPENPTGVVYDRREMETLRELCERFGLYLISDEVYREFIYDGHVRFTSILDLEGFEEHAILIDSISKRFSSCGARIGSIVSRNRGVMELVDKFAQARLCPPTVGQLAADAATCRVVQGGIVRSRQGVNLPGVKLSVAALGPVDRDNAVWAAQSGIDFVGPVDLSGGCGQATDRL